MMVIAFLALNQPQQLQLQTSIYCEIIHTPTVSLTDKQMKDKCEHGEVAREGYECEMSHKTRCLQKKCRITNMSKMNASLLSGLIFTSKVYLHRCRHSFKTSYIISSPSVLESSQQRQRKKANLSLEEAFNFDISAFDLFAWHPRQ